MQTAPGPFSGTVDYDAVTTRAQTIDLGDSPAEMRRGFERLLLGDSPAADTRPLVGLGGVEARLSGAASLTDYSGRVGVWFHGGGYVFGSPETHRRVVDAFAEALGHPVVAPRYRLAPEHAWPAQLDDARAVVRALQQRGNTVLVAGDSAGGHLALNLAIALGRAGHPPAGVALFSPNTDRSGLNATRALHSETDPIVDDGFDGELAMLCFEPSGLPLDHPEVSPVYADLSVLPRTHIEVGGRELLRDDATVLHAFAKRAGADVTLHEEAAAFHMWQVWTPYLAPGTESLERAAEALRG